MNLNDRIARLEARLQPNMNIPVFMVVMDGRGDCSQPFFIEHEGSTWTQEPGEPLANLQERAKQAALRSFRPTGRFDTLFLVARRPGLTQEQWMTRYS